MYTVTKNGRAMRLQNDVQLAAFIKSGWDEVGDDPRLTDTPEAEKLTALKAEADALGVEYHPNIGAEKLEQRISEFKAAQQ